MLRSRRPLLGLLSSPRSFASTLGLTFALGFGLSTSAQAQHSADRVVTAFEPDNPFDVHVGVEYGFRYHGAALRREWVHEGRRVLARDLLYRSYRHSLIPTIDIGLFRGLAFYAQLPVVLRDERDYRFDRSSAKGCVDPGQAQEGTPATCVNKTNSTTMRDGIIPNSGFSAERQGGPFLAYPAADTETIFRSPIRRGIDQLHLGLKYAILQQSKISAFPTWIVAFESRLGIGSEQKMRRVMGQAPAGNRLVGRRIHEFGFWTSVHRRYRFIQPYANGYARWSVGAKTSAMGRIKAPGTPAPGPQNKMGMSMGAMIVPWVQPEKNLRFAIEVQGNLDYVGRGHAYAQGWELFSDSPALVGPRDPSGAVCSVAAALEFARLNPSNPTDYLQHATSGPEQNCVAFSGITKVAAHATLGGTLNLRLNLGPWAELSVGSTISSTTQHLITGESLGVPNIAGDPNLIDLGTLDMNPQRRDVIDRPGRRYAADDIVTARVHSSLRVTF